MNMDEELNYLGATIFWSYIIAALTFSGVVIYTIISIPTPPAQQNPHRSTDVAIFCALACTSFATLSYNMLNVLIHSFASWNQQSLSLYKLAMADIWRWSTESTLFQDFGEAIVASTARHYWTQAALMATMSVGLFMGAEGHRRNVPRLWAFFCLAQILPISFTQNLFYLALLRLPQADTHSAARRRPIFWMLFVYTFCLRLARRGGIWLLASILIARISLFAPLFLCRAETNNGTHDENVADGMGMQKILIAISVHLLVWWHYSFTRDIFTVSDILRSLFEHPAVSSLGCDFIICTLSFGVWTWISKRRPPMMPESNAKSSES